MSLTIPAGYRSALLALSKLTDDDFAALYSSMSSELNPRPLSKLADKVRHRLGKDILDLDALVDVVTALYNVRLGSERRLDDFVREVSAEMSRADSIGGDKVPASAGVALEDRLSKLLNIGSLTIAAKASDVQFGYERVFESARIFTDMRAVFGGEGGSEVRGAVLVNQLRISCVEGSGVKDFFVALDHDDLVALKKVIERAEAKMKTLAALLAQAGVSDLDADKG